jgi:hypothetical protein
MVLPSVLKNSLCRFLTKQGIKGVGTLIFSDHFMFQNLLYFPRLMVMTPTLNIGKYTSK